MTEPTTRMHPSHPMRIEYARRVASLDHIELMREYEHIVRLETDLVNECGKLLDDNTGKYDSAVRRHNGACMKLDTVRAEVQRRLG